MPEALSGIPPQEIEGEAQPDPSREIAVLSQETLPYLKKLREEGRLSPYDFVHLGEYNPQFLFALHPPPEIWDKLKNENEENRLQPEKYVIGLSYLQTLDPSRFKQEIIPNRSLLEQSLPLMWADYQKIYGERGLTMEAHIPDVFRGARALKRTDPLLFEAKIRGQEVFQKEILPLLAEMTEQAKTKGDMRTYLGLAEVASELLPENKALLTVEPNFWNQIKREFEALVRSKPLDFFRYAKAASQLQIATRK